MHSFIFIMYIQEQYIKELKEKKDADVRDLHGIYIYWPSPSNQSFYRQITDHHGGVGDHRVGQ